MVAETHLGPEHLIYPLFLLEDDQAKVEVGSMPGNYRMGVEPLLKTIEKSLSLGIDKFDVFPVIPESYKDKEASYATAEKNFYYRIIKAIKDRFPEATLMSDVALDPYNSDGHDGLVKNGEILNDETLDVLAEMSVMQADAGIDIIGPSDMMDGRVGAIRDALDQKGHKNVSIMSYTAKYASAFYNPFRDALDSAPKAGDKKTYQMDPANKREALLEAQLDAEEGADMLMVKPALCYLDIVNELSQTQDLPITAYNVSGECAMLYAAAQKGWLEYEPVMAEMLLSIRRAGATGILTYFAMDFAQWYHQK